MRGIRGVVDDDDAPKKPALKSGTAKTEEPKEKEPEDSFEVWTPFGDCGISFQTGETYLVYASDDEETSDSVATDSCTRTRRLSEAGEDLACLFFYKEHPEAAIRLEGFTTTNQRYRLEFDPQHPERIGSLAEGVVIELQSDRLTRYTESDRNGRFVCDGLAKGNTAYRPTPADTPRTDNCWQVPNDLTRNRRVALSR